MSESAIKIEDCNYSQSSSGFELSAKIRVTISIVAIPDWQLYKDARLIQIYFQTRFYFHLGQCWHVSEMATWLLYR